MAITPGAPVSPDRLLDITMNHINFVPASDDADEDHLFVDFGNGYAIYRDDKNVNDTSGDDRVWFATPNDGDMILGPRGGGSYMGSFTLKCDATTASAGNLFLNTANYRIYRSTSSIKYKVNVKDAGLDLDALKKMRPVTFNDRAEYQAWLDNKRQGEKPTEYVGFIAEELEELGLSHFIQYHGETGKPDGIQYDRLTVGLLALVQDLYARVEALEGR